MFGLPEADCYSSHACHYSFDTWSENSIIRPITDFTEIYKENIKVRVKWGFTLYWSAERQKLNCIFNSFILLQCMRSIWLWKPVARKQNSEPWTQQNFQQNSERHLSLIIKTSSCCSSTWVGPGQQCQRCLSSQQHWEWALHMNYTCSWT